MRPLFADQRNDVAECLERFRQIPYLPAERVEFSAAFVGLLKGVFHVEVCYAGLVRVDRVNCFGDKFVGGHLVAFRFIKMSATVGALRGRFGLEVREV